jgi:hypothetical protein
VLAHPAVWLGVALGVLQFFGLEPFAPSNPMTWLLPALTLIYLVFGLVRGQARMVQLLGLLGFSAVALAALLVDPDLGQYLVAAGWIGHAIWDFAHRHGRVVPRWFVYFCLPADLLFAASLIVVAIR